MNGVKGGFVFSGDLYLDRYGPAGKRSGRIDMGNATRCAIQAMSERMDLPSRRRDTLGQNLRTFTQPRPSTIGITLNQASIASLALAFLGGQEAINHSQATVAGESITLNGYAWTALSRRYLEAESVLVELDETEYEEGTDYEVHYRLGMIRRVPGGDIADEAEVEVSFGAEAKTGTSVAGVSQPEIRTELVLDGLNHATGRDGVLSVPVCTLAPEQPIDFLAEGWIPVQLAGVVEIPPGGGAPFQFDEYDTAGGA